MNDDSADELGGLTAQCALLLDQAVELVEQLSDEEFASPTAGVGTQLRHCIDYFSCFFAGLEAGQIDYDLRKRDSACESDPLVARKRLDDLSARFAAGLDTCADQAVEIRVDETASPAEQTWTRSSVGRELRFLISHTIHHFALIGMIVRLHGRNLAPCFGVAPSTMRHWGTEPPL